VALPAPERTCLACGWKSHERPENVRDWERSWEVHEQQLCPARAWAARPAPLAIAPTAEPVPLRPDATCAACGGWLSATVVADGFDTHPSCDLPTVADAPRPVPATPQPAALAPVINLFDR
jgi:hypothetical protein